MADLFNKRNFEDDLRDAMASKWEADIAVIAKRRVIPDWKGEPKPLSRDKAALLEYLYEHGFIVWQSGPSKEKAAVAKIMGYSERRRPERNPGFDLGLPDATIAIANAAAVIDSCEREGLIEKKLYRGQEVYQMTIDGEFALNDWQLEREMGFL